MILTYFQRPKIILDQYTRFECSQLAVYNFAESYNEMKPQKDFITDRISHTQVIYEIFHKTKCFKRIVMCSTEPISVNPDTIFVPFSHTCA